MSRLTDKDSYCFVTCADDYKGTESIGENCKLYKACFERKMYDKLKHYEDLEEAGRLIELPCAIGDDVYIVPSKVNFDLNVLSKHEENNRVYHQKVSCVVIEDDNWYLQCDKDREYGTGRLCLDVSFGKTWFLTKAEAEAKLEEMERANE